MIAAINKGSIASTAANPDFVIASAAIYGVIAAIAIDSIIASAATKIISE
jgi:hypothetical protein